MARERRNNHYHRGGIVFAAVLVALFLTSAHAAPVPLTAHPWRYDHIALTHSAPTPALDAMLVDAIHAWGMEDGGPGRDLVVDYAPLGMPGPAYMLPLIDYRPDGIMRECGIFLAPSWFAAEGLGAAPWFAMAVLTHEVGHCVGLDHPATYGDSVMLSNVPAPTAFDLAALREIYPFGHRVVIAGIRHE